MQRRCRSLRASRSSFFWQISKEKFEGCGKLFDAFEEGVGFCCAKAFFGGERAKNGDGAANAGAAGHLEIFWRVTDVDGVLWVEAHAAKREF